MSEDTEGNNSGSQGNAGTLGALATIFKELGLPSFLIVIVVGIFFLFGSPEQKSEFIDRFILLKNVQEDPFPFAIVVASLLLIIIIGGYYQQKEIKKLKSENRRIGDEKTELQTKLIEKDLRSSRK